MTTAAATTETWATESTGDFAPSEDIKPQADRFRGDRQGRVSDGREDDARIREKRHGCRPHQWPLWDEATLRQKAGAAPRGPVPVWSGVATRTGRSPAELSAAPVPETRDLETLRAAAARCRACPLWRHATQTVFGEGRARARVLVVGEQPGDQEDRAGRPFVGPAGRLLDQAFEAAGVDRAALFVTNAVKHFKWVPRGKRRLHEKPAASELAACRPWLEAEIRSVRPEVIVCLGATAARSIIGRVVRVLSERGRWVETDFGVPALITVHPSALLRLRDRSEVAAAFDALVADLRKIEPRTSEAAPRNAQSRGSK